MKLPRKFSKASGQDRINGWVIGAEAMMEVRRHLKTTAAPLIVVEDIILALRDLGYLQIEDDSSFDGHLTPPEN